jgi:hypothetical protein
MRFIDEVCEMFDVEILCDIEETEHDPLGVDWTGLRETETRVTPVIALGCRAEMAAGLTGFVMTPWFHDEAKLEGFLGYHIDTLRAMCHDDAPAPNMCDWAQWSLS